MEKIPARVKLTTDEYKMVTADYGPYPCSICPLSEIEKSSCSGCSDRSEWYQSFTDMPEDLRELAWSYNDILTFSYRISKLKENIEKLEAEQATAKKKFFDYVICDKSDTDA